MSREKSSVGFAALLMILTAGLLTSSAPVSAQTESVLYSFGQNSQDTEPYFPPVVGPGGTLYVSTVGDVDQLTPSGGGTWNEAAIASLSSSGFGEPLAIGPDGNLYGTTITGGEYGGGSVFELSPGLAGWTETILHSFSLTGKDGNGPWAG